MLLPHESRPGDRRRLVTQVDTASGAQNDIEAIGKARDAAGSDALLLVDAVAPLGCMPFEWTSGAWTSRWPTPRRG
jgi:aspartate aminotransferase-like enzyme